VTDCCLPLRGVTRRKIASLPYLLRPPLDRALLRKAPELWRATARLYCHRFEEAWPEDAGIVEQTPVLLCHRRGAAIDLVLDRPRRARSQFVFTQLKGREAIFWQTQKTARAASPPAAGSPADAPSPSRSRSPSIPVSATLPLRSAGVRNGPGSRSRRRLRGLHPDGTMLAAVERKSEHRHALEVAQVARRLDERAGLHHDGRLSVRLGLRAVGQIDRRYVSGHEKGAGPQDLRCSSAFRSM
jgi:hypothetical protein